MTPHSIILGWRIPWTEEPGGPWGCQESGTISTHTMQLGWIFLQYVFFHPAIRMSCCQGLFCPSVIYHIFEGFLCAKH